MAIHGRALDFEPKKKVSGPKTFGFKSLTLNQQITIIWSLVSNQGFDICFTNLLWKLIKFNGLEVFASWQVFIPWLINLIITLSTYIS
jgi:hypothetical protein